MDNNEILTCLQGNWTSKLDQLNIHNLEIYFHYYLPKYISCFANSGIDGKLIFGINDDSELTGVPFNGTLTVANVNSFYKKSLKRYVKEKFDSNLVRITIVELDKNPNILDDDIGDMLDFYENKIKEYKKVMSIYREKKKKWIQKLNYYSTKIRIYLNDPFLRRELIEYVIQNNGESHIVDLLKSDEEIEMPLTEIFIQRKLDKNDVMYWVAIYRDVASDLVLLEKPKKPEIDKRYDISNLLIQISRLRKRLVGKVNYYLIVFDIKGSQFTKKMHFRYPRSKEWISRQRIQTEKGPGCK